MIMAMCWIVLWIVMARLDKWLATAVLLIVVGVCINGIYNHSLRVTCSTHYTFFANLYVDFSSSALLRSGYRMLLGICPSVHLPVQMRKGTCSFDFPLIVNVHALVKYILPSSCDCL